MIQSILNYIYRVIHCYNNNRFIIIKVINKIIYFYYILFFNKIFIYFINFIIK